MKKKYIFFKNSFLFSTVLFIGFSFEFFIRNDFFLGFILILIGVMNLVAYQGSIRRVKSIDIILNLINAILSFFITDSYGNINYETLYFFWWLIFCSYLILILAQIRSKINSNRKKKKIRDRFN